MCVKNVACLFVHNESICGGIWKLPIEFGFSLRKRLMSEWHIWMHDEIIRAGTLRKGVVLAYAL